MKKLFLTTAFACVTATAASAATVDVSLQEFSNRADALAAQQALLGTLAVLRYEDFEDFTAFDTAYPNSTNTNPANPDPSLYDFAGAAATDALSTSVGDFTSILPQGTGGSNREPDDAAIVRANANENNNSQPNFGRYDADLTDVGANFLDSNDNAGIRLNTAPMPEFTSLSFIITDLDDVGGVNFDITATGATITSNTHNNPIVQGNGDIFLATLTFSTFVTGVTVDMSIDTNDGFGVDSFAVAAVPLPASAAMLLAGLAGMGAMSRRTRRKDG